MKRKRKTRLPTNLPEPLKEVSWLLEPMLELGPMLEQLDPREARTAQQRLAGQVERSFEACLADEGYEGIVPALLNVLADSDTRVQVRQAMKEALAEVGGEAVSDPRYAVLTELVEEVDRRAPFVAGIVLRRVFAAGHTVSECEPVEALQDCSTLRGERRARAVIRAVREVAENLYEPYLNIVCDLGHLARAEPLKIINRFGVLVDHAARLLCEDRYPGLVDADAGFLRNCASHGRVRRWEYEPDSDTITMCDANGRSGRFTVDDLHERALRMFMVAGPVLRTVATETVVRMLYTEGGIIDMIASVAPRLASTDPVIVADAERELNMLLEQRGASTRAFFEGIEATR